MRKLTSHNYLVFCILFILLYVGFQVECLLPFTSSSPNSTLSSHLKQCSALLQFKNTFAPCLSSFSLPSWVEGKDCCSWDGVKCNKAMGNVIGLDLSDTCLKGSINHNSSLFHLSHLQWLDFSSNKITGSIPASIGNLTRLTELDFSSNSISGQLPTSLSNLQQLTHLVLSENLLTGQIPDIFGNLSKLISLDLSINSFSWQLPHSLFNLNQLTELLIFSNRLTGLLPHHVSGLPNLIELSLSFNFLVGGIPPWLFSLQSLETIDLANNILTGPIDRFHPPYSLTEVYLGNNKLNGEIPSFFFELVNLTVLDFSSNNFSGIVKFDMLSKLENLISVDISHNSLLSFSSNYNINHTMPSLQYLILSSCNISEFPSSLSTLESLKWLDLSNNNIHGRISKSESKGWKRLVILNVSHNFLTSIEQHPWKKIIMLDLENNILQGSLRIPPPTTRVFLVSNNNLTGQIPPSICNLGSLHYLSLSNNNLSGTIPQCLGNSSIILSMLHLRKNNLQGKIPDTFASGIWLRSLDLNGNKLEGPLPRSLINCSCLEVINIGNNKISDAFPSWLRTLVELKVVILRSNRFYGPISDSKIIFPFSKLQIIDLSHNELTGFLPRTLFENLKAMMKVDEEDHKSRIQYIGDEYYQGSSTVTMKGLDIYMEKILTIFTSIDLSNNSFQGEIPEILGNLKSLHVLNLSHNNLTGNIPLSLGNLTALESLDFSSNKLDGRIPEQLKSLTFLEVLNLSYNQFWGPIPQGNQFATYGSDSFIGNKGLCGQPLPEKCSNDGARQSPSVFHEEDNASGEFDWNVAMTGYGAGLVIGLSTGYIVFSMGKPQWLVRMVESGQKNVRRLCRRY